MCATKSLCKAKSRLPLWGALVPSGHRSALDRAGRRECHAFGMTERASAGSPPSFREAAFSVRRRSGKAGQSPCFPSFSLADAHKVKGKVETFLKKSFIKKLYSRFARPSFHFFHLTYRKKELQLC